MLFDRAGEREAGGICEGVLIKMPSHFSTIGLPITNSEEFVALAEKLASMATPVKATTGTYLRWSSLCGAEVWLQVNAANDLIGMVPYFAGQSEVRVGITHRVPRDGDSHLEGALHGWADPSELKVDEGCYPFVFDLVDYGCYEELRIPSVAHARIAAFAHEATTYSSPEEFRASQAETPKFGIQSFIPSGLFTPDGSKEAPRSEAVFAGQIKRTELKNNELTGESYYWALIDTYGGCFDVVIDRSLPNTPPQVGGVLFGSFWLSGRLSNFTKGKPGFWHRMFGKKGW